MQVSLLKENPDGSADYRFDLTEEERQAIMCHGIVKALEVFVKDGEQYVASDANLDNT